MEIINLQYQQPWMDRNLETSAYSCAPNNSISIFRYGLLGYICMIDHWTSSIYQGCLDSMGKYEGQRKVSRPGIPQTWHLKIGEMRSNEKLADQVTPQTRHLKKRGNEVQRNVGRPGNPQTWCFKNRGYEVQQKVGRPGTPLTRHLKNRGNEVQQKVGTQGPPHTWCLKFRRVWFLYTHLAHNYYDIFWSAQKSDCTYIVMKKI